MTLILRIFYKKLIFNFVRKYIDELNDKEVDLETIINDPNYTIVPKDLELIVKSMDIKYKFGMFFITNKFNKQDKHDSYLFLNGEYDNTTPIISLYQSNEQSLSNIVVNKEYYFTLDEVEQNQKLKKLIDNFI